MNGWNFHRCQRPSARRIKQTALCLMMMPATTAAHPATTRRFSSHAQAAKPSCHQVCYRRELHPRASCWRPSRLLATAPHLHDGQCAAGAQQPVRFPEDCRRRLSRQLVRDQAQGDQVCRRGRQPGRLRVGMHELQRHLTVLQLALQAAPPTAEVKACPTYWCKGQWTSLSGSCVIRSVVKQRLTEAQTDTSPCGRCGAHLPPLLQVAADGHHVWAQVDACHLRPRERAAHVLRAEARRTAQIHCICNRPRIRLQNRRACIQSGRKLCFCRSCSCIPRRGAARGLGNPLVDCHSQTLSC